MLESCAKYSDWKKGVDISYWISVKNLFLFLWIFSSKKNNVWMKIFWIFPFHWFQFTGMCIFIKNWPNVLHKYIGIGKFWLAEIWSNGHKVQKWYQKRMNFSEPAGVNLKPTWIIWILFHWLRTGWYFELDSALKTYSQHAWGQ